MGNDLAKQDEGAVDCKHNNVATVMSPFRYGWEGTCKDCGKKVFASMVEYRMSKKVVFREGGYGIPI